MNPHKMIPDLDAPEPALPWEEEGAWPQKARKRAKTELYAVADSLDQAGVSQEEVCRFLSIFGQQIGSGSVTNWETRMYDYAEESRKKFHCIENGPNL
jgi:hypothetical protein